MSNPFVHIELNTTDLPQAKTFYQNLFHWKLQDIAMPSVPEGKYTMIHVGGGTGGGMMKHPIPDADSAWLPYVHVDDIRATTDRARELGATVLMDVTEITDRGWLSLLIDPTGATIGLWQPLIE